MAEKQLCPTCVTGEKTYILDSKEPSCPYQSYYKSGKCPFYKEGKK